MALRRIPLVTGETYHLFNRSVGLQPVFLIGKDYQRFLEVVDFYRFEHPSMRFSHYVRLELEQKKDFLDRLYKKSRLLEIFAFSFMPNHFHFMVKQLREGGVKTFASQIQNSYAKYFNTKNKRGGALFQEMFKAVRIESEEQLIHTMRYIHINPLTSYVLRRTDQLEKYPWTSLIDYLGYRKLPMVEISLLNYFGDLAKLRKFTFDQVDYQRMLERIKHLALE